MYLRSLFAVSAIVCASFAVPSLAQDASMPVNAVQTAGGAGQDPSGPNDGSDETVFDGDFFTIGAGAAISPSYIGSDDYVFSALPVVAGSYKGVTFTPRVGGLTVDFIPDPEDGVGFDLGLSARVRANRTSLSRIDDVVVEQFGELDTAIEVGPAIGVTFPKVLNPYDSLSFLTEVMFDVASAHDGYVVVPTATYFTPLSQGIAASLSLSAEWADSDFQDYNFGVDPAEFTGVGPLPVAPFDPDGGGFTSADATLFVAIDLDGDLTNGGLSLVTITGYSYLLGDAANTPFTSERGSRSQFFGVLGVAYTF